MANVADAATDVEVAGKDSAKPAGKKKKLMMIGGAIAVLAAAAGGGYFFLTGGENAHEGEAVVAEKPPIFIDLPDMMVNLAVPADRPQYLKLKIALEVSDERLVERINPMMPRVLDAFQVHLREMRPADLDGSAGLYRLKEELLRRINAAVYPGKVEAILFKEVLVQ
ncbi:flagellar basal body protein FliL [Agaricicola taiwanensis]|uniref:Flagellar protein FliL n=1 Tax=Agaricicola taiwanensis TaxID=591372 RepID=A0A8J2YH46_9RHOB|nr:flagellar basal body-associated protein FliL [Agaricicola taiwanensis]GGE40639.1 flagellar basal body protein FliL [Agaricicola taiwanensis]